MQIISIDPGPKQSAWLHYRDGAIGTFGLIPNEDVLQILRSGSNADHLACEMIQSYGMAVGKEVFETCLWIGRFIEAWGRPYTLIYRKDVKMHLCGSTRAKDGNIRQALIDRFGAAGTKKAPGATYGISKDVWAALAVAATFSDQIKAE